MAHWYENLVKALENYVGGHEFESHLTQPILFSHSHY
jgi:hypothetical protein